MFKVGVWVEDAKGIRVSVEQEDVSLPHLDYMLGGLPLAYSLPLSKELREKGLREPASLKAA